MTMDEKNEIPAAQATPASGMDVQDLKAAREARGLSLMDVFRATRVSMINLTAVENGDFHRLPPGLHAKFHPQVRPGCRDRREAAFGQV